jgi:hypothetical protein
MDTELEEIRQAMDKSTGDGRDRDEAVRLSDAYVAAHPETFAGLDKFDLPLLVQLVSEKRNAGDEQGQWEIEAWLLHAYEPQSIGGEYQPQLRVPGL